MKPHPLKVAREARGWSQSKVAESLGVATRTVLRWEQRQAIPYPYYREQLCTLFNASASELGLIEEKGEENGENGQLEIPKDIPDMLNPSERFLIDPAIPQMLDPVGQMLGRDFLLLTQLKQQLLQENPLSRNALNGMPGVGKTALAVALCADAEIRAHFPDGIMWIELGPRPNLSGLLARWGNLLGLASDDVLASNSLEAWSNALRTCLEQRRMLLIIDDAWSAIDGMTFLVGGSQCGYLLTTRMPQVAFAFARESAILVPELEPADRLSLVERYVPELVKQDRQGMQYLVEMVGGLPLAISLISKYLAAVASKGQLRRLKVALEYLRTAQQHVQVSLPSSHGSSLPMIMPPSLQSSITFSHQRLGAGTPAFVALIALSVFPAKPNSFSEEVALVVSQQSAVVLEQLCDVGLLERSRDGRYCLHQAVADYAHAQLNDATVERRLVTYMLLFLQAHKQDYDILEPEINNILAALDVAVAGDMRQDLVQAIDAFVAFRHLAGQHEQADVYLRHALQAAKEMQDEPAQQRALQLIGAFAEQREKSSEVTTSASTTAAKDKLFLLNRTTAEMVSRTTAETASSRTTAEMASSRTTAETGEISNKHKTATLSTAPEIPLPVPLTVHVSPKRRRDIALLVGIACCSIVLIIIFLPLLINSLSFSSKQQALRQGSVSTRTSTTGIGVTSGTPSTTGTGAGVTSDMTPTTGVTPGVTSTVGVVTSGTPPVPGLTPGVTPTIAGVKPGTLPAPGVTSTPGVTPPGVTPTPGVTPVPVLSVSYEAEAASNTLDGTHLYSCTLCSGGVRVAWLGNAIVVQFNKVSVATEGDYTLTLYYLNSVANRVTAASVSINGGPYGVIPGIQVSTDTHCCATTVPQVTSTSVHLLAGNNTLRIGNPAGPAPDIDRIVIG